MKGVNHFRKQHLFEESASVTLRNCVFISYSRHDKDEALEVVKMIQDLGIDFYFDQHDAALQLADEAHDHQKVVACIESGLDHATTLLGIITENTKDSWWVPYEIGSATGRGRAHAHLITRKVESLPSYIRASTVLLSQEKLDEWLLEQIDSKLRMTDLIFEQAGRELRGDAILPASAPIPWRRSLSDLAFY